MQKEQPPSSLIVEDIPVIAAERSEGISGSSASSSSMRPQFGDDMWSDTVNHRSKKDKRKRLIMTYAGVGIVSFLLFLYLSFPFNVVKEVVVSKTNEILIQQQLPIRVSVGDFNLKFPVGISLEDIQLTNVNEPLATVKIGRASFSFHVLPLLIGQLEGDLRLTQSGGSLDVSIGSSIAGLVKLTRSPSALLPSGSMRATFVNFEVRPFIDNALAFVRSGNSPMLQTIQPFLRTEVSGQISGSAHFDLPEIGESLDRATADLDFKINQAYFEMRDETLAIPRQEFSEARIKLKLIKKSIEIPTDTRLLANDIGINLSGRMNVSDNFLINDVKLKLGLTLKGKIEENFKTLLPIILGCDLSKMVGGKMDVELSGNFSALTCS
jgi:type II secretion system protein N